jgi:hypothetical protein
VLRQVSRAHDSAGKRSKSTRSRRVERKTGLEPATSAWKECAQIRIGYENGVTLAGARSQYAAATGTGAYGDHHRRAGRFEYGPRVRFCIWPPLRPARLRRERGCVGVVVPAGVPMGGQHAQHRT